MTTSREDIIRRINALKAKSEAAGATEAEAASAASKVAELMAAYELEEADLAISENRAPEFDIGSDPYFTEGKHTPKVWMCAHYIQRLCRVRVRIKNMGSANRIMIYGDRPDRENARFLFLLIDAALQREYAKFAIANRSNLSRSSKPSFQSAMAYRISARLAEIVRNRDNTSESRALVVIDAKAAAIDEYLGSTKVKTHKAKVTARDRGAMTAGYQAGDRLGLDRPVSHETKPLIG